VMKLPSATFTFTPDGMAIGLRPIRDISELQRRS
jgi:hypothetical protein